MQTTNNVKVSGEPWTYTIDSVPENIYRPSYEVLDECRSRKLGAEISHLRLAPMPAVWIELGPRVTALRFLSFFSLCS